MRKTEIGEISRDFLVGEKEDGTYSGIKWELNEKFELIPESVHYECQNCGGKIHEKDKQSLNLKGKWIPTEKPKRPQFRSYQLNAIVIPPGFTSWIDLVYKWLDACPPNGFIDNVRNNLSSKTASL